MTGQQSIKLALSGIWPVRIGLDAKSQGDPRSWAQGCPYIVGGLSEPMILPSSC